MRHLPKLSLPKDRKMKAKFDISINDMGVSPRSVTHTLYSAIVRHVDNAQDRNLAIVSPCGVLFVDEDGKVAYSDREWFNETHLVVELVPEVNITFKM